jgi:hypothetical protein
MRPSQTDLRSWHPHPHWSEPSSRRHNGHSPLPLFMSSAFSPQLEDMKAILVIDVSGVFLFFVPSLATLSFSPVTAAANTSHAGCSALYLKPPSLNSHIHIRKRIINS